MRLLLSILLSASLCTAPINALATSDGLNAHIDSTIADVNRLLSRDERSPASWGLERAEDVKIWNKSLQQIRSLRPGIVQRTGRIVALRFGPEEVVFELLNVEKGHFKFGSHTIDISKAQGLSDVRKALAELPQFKDSGEREGFSFSFGLPKAHAYVGYALLALLAFILFCLYGDYGIDLYKGLMAPLDCATVRAAPGGGAATISDEEAQETLKKMRRLEPKMPVCTLATSKENNPKEYNSPGCQKLRFLIDCVSGFSKPQLQNLGVVIEGYGEHRTLRFLQPTPAPKEPWGGLF